MLLVLVVFFFVVGVVYDLWGLLVSCNVLLVMLIVGLGFFGVILFYLGIFLVFIVYEGLVFIFVLGVYIYLVVWGELIGVVFMVVGILVSILVVGI